MMRPRSSLSTPRRAWRMAWSIAALARRMDSEKIESGETAMRSAWLSLSALACWRGTVAATGRLSTVATCSSVVKPPTRFS
ncbi:hypothetical protein D3C87_2017160 [compost metagenome]